MSDDPTDPGGIPSWRPPARAVEPERRRWQVRLSSRQRRTPIAIASVRRSALTGWGLGIAGAFLLLLAFALAVISTQRERAKIGSTVKAYVSARAAGDAGKACDKMTTGEWRDLVSRASGTAVATATRTDCERWVLSNSTASPYTSSKLGLFRSSGYKFRVNFGPDREAAIVYPEGLGSPAAELIKQRGSWKIDGLAFERVSFINYCGDMGRSKGRCRCLFDQLRSRNYDSWSEFHAALSIMKSRSANGDLSAADAACSGGVPAGSA